MLFCGNAEIPCSRTQLSDSLCAQHRHDCTIRIHLHLPPWCREFRRATVFVGDAVNIYRLSLCATSCLTKINYSSRRRCTKHPRTPLFITSRHADSNVSLHCCGIRIFQINRRSFLIWKQLLAPMYIHETSCCNLKKSIDVASRWNKKLWEITLRSVNYKSHYKLCRWS